MATIEHSTELGGLVPLPGWYVLKDDGEAVGPFETETEAHLSADPERNLPFSGSF